MVSEVFSSYDRGAMAVPAGMNPIVALQEAEIPVVYKSVSTLGLFSELEYIDEIRGKI